MKRQPKNPFRKDCGRYQIELRLRDIDQFFNSLDPSPFHEKDIDDDAERYIVNSVRSFPLSTKLKLVFLLPQVHHQEAVMVIPSAITNYFEFRVSMTIRERKALLQEGRTALLLGLTFLVSCMTLKWTLSFLPDALIKDMIAEGLSIIGWVAMWRPIQIFLYEWWALRRNERVYTKIRDLPLSIDLE